MARLLAGVLVCASLCASNGVVLVDEGATRVVLQDQRSTLLLAVTNPTSDTLTANVRLEWLGESGTVLWESDCVERLKPGRIILRLPVESGAEIDSVWLRVRYRIAAGGAETTGILPVASIADHFFELRMATPFVAGAGETVSIPVYASHPVTRRPVSGVRITGKDDDQRVEGVTGADGVATLRFRMPEHPEDQEEEITVEGVLGDFSQEVQGSLTINRQPRVMITTDKPLYQPGQILHMRALVFTPAGRAMSGTPVSLRVSDPDSVKVFTAAVETSRFGVAAADWPIPDNLRLGDYTVTVHGESFVVNVSQPVRISRYDLPEFTVTAKPDRPYYLYGQDASIQIKAEYLFGKPVPRGHVRVVREASRRWDWRAQKWDIDEAETYEADADQSGRANVAVKLGKARKDQEPWDRFSDVGFTAYYRDPSTGRTEQRRFDVRITRDRIHIYLSNGYMFTSYADGAPAACKVTVNGGASVQTNRYGVARLPSDLEDGDRLLEADDGRGATGRQDERYRSRTEPDVRIRADRTLYRPGEPVHVEIETVDDQPSLAFTIRKADALLETRWLALHDRRAAFDVPWRKDFTREVTFAVSWGSDVAVRTVLFPANNDLRVEVKPAAAVYRPGDEASAAIGVKFDGGPVESVLGVAVVDRAVSERVRTDWGEQIGAERLGGMTREDLYRLDISQPFPEGLDLLAEAMLGESGWGSHLEVSSEYEDGLLGVFHKSFDVEFVLSLLGHGTPFRDLRDPWGTPYRLEHRFKGPIEEFEFASAGPDKRFGTRDDFPAWVTRRFHFQPTRDALAKALYRAPDFPTTADSLRVVLQPAGITPDRLPDPWGHMYRLCVGIRGEMSIVSFVSAGADGVFGTKDDFTAGEIEGRYFAHEQQRIADRLASAKVFPQNERDWRAFLRKTGLDPRDPWGNPLHPVFAHRSMYTDMRKLYTAAKYGGKPAPRTQIVPVTMRYLTITLRSDSQDGFDLATFTRNYRFEAAAKQEGNPGGRYPGGGTIAGRVTDPTGALVPCAAVTALRAGATYETHCGIDGRFRLDGVEPGLYELRVQSPGFQNYVTTSVPVTARRRTVLDVVLQVGSVSETVTVTAELPMLSTSSVQVSSGMVAARRSTPRLREYFPETLLWQPSLETGADGQAQVKFKMADSITTWEVQVIGSTVDGKMGSASAEIRVFQPFFVDLDPPCILTQDDRIDMPVTVRNYLDQAQNVAVSLQPENWLELAGPARRDARVGAGESANAVFPLRAKAAIVDGKQRVTAGSAAAADAIEKPVTVHPDGREIAATVNTVLRRQGELSFDLPANTIPRSARVELKIYPNLLSHLLESFEAILQRPHGCAEQTISSTYPNLMLLRYLDRMGRIDHPLAGQARRNLRAGVDRLLGYTSESGGISYWGGGAADLSLTAYGLQFLTEAAPFATVDERVIEGMRDSLWKQQSPDGFWGLRRSALLTTAYVTQVLAGPSGPVGLRRALGFLAAHSSELDEPYMLAAYALAAHKSGDETAFHASLDRLRGMAHEEDGMRYWNLDTNTPFYGWGLAGRLETTAIVVRALAAGGRPRDAESIAQGMLFLLRHKDRHGVWYSTQASVQVLKAILEAGGSESPSGATAAGATTAEILINGRAAATLSLPGSGEVTGPVRADISAHLALGTNRIVVRHSGIAASQMQVAGTYYVPWQKVAANDQLRLGVRFDRTAAAVGEPVNCRVHVERVGFHGHGMLLAEIGLPPGADVDRQSLENAGLDHYDVLPDRIIVYLWPRAGGLDFRFRFRPRFAMRAKAAPSLLYDYYNPDARAVAAPASFAIGTNRQ
jgi:hypothetical protein